MARPWRLRHKLFLGLALVVASIALLLGGAVFGFSSFVEASRTTGHKLNLMQVVVTLRDHVHMMSVPPDPATADPSIPQRARERSQIGHYIDQAEQSVAGYRNQIAGGQGHSDADPDEGAGERQLLDGIQRELNSLKAEIEKTKNSVSGIGDRRVIDEAAVRGVYDKLSANATELFQLNKNHIDLANARAASNHRRGMIVAVTATIMAVVLLLTLLYYFRVWVFRPIKSLQRGVQRVHRGDFEHPINIQSRDELEELANAFNAMTARLRDTYKNLADQVNERSRQLVRSERMVSVGFLAAGVAHEINNPLHSISLYSEALERRVQEIASRVTPEAGQELNNYLRVIQQEAFRCKDITRKLLDFSRPGETKRERTDLGKLIEDVIEVARPLPNARGKTIQYSPGCLTAAISPPDLKSVVLNLIVNALDSMEEGGILAIGLESAEGQAVLRFRDSGCGMTAEVLGNIFEPFFTRKRTGNGTGLGLSISHQIIDQHGGSIEAASAGAGQGSTFTVRLPMEAPEQTTETEATLLSFPAGRLAA